MAVKGTLAKESVIEKIKSAFGDNFVGIYEKKVYVWGEENGERVQVCLSLTCPKTPIGQVESFTIGNRMEFEEAIEVPTQTTEVTQEEKDTIAQLMSKLGL